MSDIDWEERFPGLKPVKKAPALFRINGCGVGMYGRRDVDPETGAYLSTWCLALVFIPVLCLRAYRVAKAPNGGWYFLGREPLSKFAKLWNLTLVGVILASIGTGMYIEHTSSPAYRARQQMAKARDNVDAGRLAQGARIYQSLATANGEQGQEAAAAVQDLMDNRCGAAPLRECADVFACVVQVARRRQTIPLTEVADKGLKLVTDKGDSDPRAGVELLDAIRPLVVDTRAIDARRLALLRKWAASEPANLEVISPLAALLEQQNQLDEAKKLLMPVKDKLGDGEGARVLGTILGREGDYDGAYTQLWPYVKARLDRLHAAEKSFEGSMEQLQNRELQLLRQEKAPRDFYERYENSGKDQQQAMVQEYINARIKNDPQFAAAQAALEHETAVVPVALDLGIVMLQRAQGQADAAARKAQLESAEQVFLAIGGVAGQSDQYRLSLGQVYYWLGKQAEGRKLFDEFLSAKGRSAEALVEVGSRLRMLGAVPDARAMAEEAYATGAKAEEKHGAASFRALMHKDTDDRIAWLQKSNTSEPHVKGSLAHALGDKAFQEGRDDEAARQYRAAADAYAAMPRSAHSLNEAALAHSALFRATGDRQALAHSVDAFQQAVDLEPSDAILLYNAGVTLLDGAVADVIGGDIDLRALHVAGGTSLFGYLYKDEAGRAALVRRVKDHPGIARAMSFLDKVTVLSPKNGHAFGALYGVHRFTRNDAALAAMEQRMRAGGLDTADDLTATREFLAGAKDAQDRATMAASLKRAEDLAGALRAKGGRTAAVAIHRQITIALTLDTMGVPADGNKLVALAEEAHRLSPSARTAGVLSNARLMRGGNELRRADADFDAFCKKYARTAGTHLLLAVAASEPGPFRQMVLGNADVRQAIAELGEQSTLFAEGYTPYEWAMLKNVDAAQAERAADGIRKVPRLVTAQAIAALLEPADAGEALETYWLMQILGKPEEARAAIRRIVDLGIPMPISR